MRIFRSFGHVFGGTLLITGTTIGVGMLALPIATGPAGFVPSVVSYLICWAFMLCTGLLLLEVCAWMPKGANLITMAHRLLGPVGEWVCWLVYLFLFITVMVAHILGGGSIFSEFSEGALSAPLAMIIYVIIFAPIVYFGTKWVDRFNIVLVAGVAITYLLFIYVAHKHVDLSLLKHSDWPKTLIAIPVLFTSFTYQVIIPTLMNYMDRNVKKVRLAIIIGSSIPLAVYLIWEFLILGIVPLAGENGLMEAAKRGHNAVIPLKYFLENPTVFSIGKYFAFFTMTASYLALALAFFDFLSDGLKAKKNGVSKFTICAIVFLVPTIIAFLQPDIFITALSYAGGISIAILFGLFPPLMAWIGRYKKHYHEQHYLLPGGRVFLGFLIILIVLELITDFLINI